MQRTDRADRPPSSRADRPPSSRRRRCLPAFRPAGGLAAVVTLLALAPLPAPASGVAEARAAAAAETARPRIFDSHEVRSANLAPFRKWQRAVLRARSEAQQDPAGDARRWSALLDPLRGADPRRQLEVVNAEMNARAYVTDPVNWGVEDYWASPGEFFARFGDCEDYAIAKYFALKRLGWNDDALRVVAVMDINLQVGHAVLIAVVGGESLLLDNQIGEVVDTRRVHHYQPVYSINESAWWRHWPQMR